ncbi:hypothetical protein CKM354_001031300 [Cercospora kikuchii]|uniref:Peptidase S8/S53 domain-containing protein n=1 Tax=Cercospora kikuchii TaxID=84275 RepID=A0A9P3CMG3_9PEZI|nr:uncharacterized protein CKM354_001031300 [Cercospora kikuchii]GIZ47214.1 hypothetical protein CKM354_001031300 [Cercospora kikuchii]
MVRPLLLVNCLLFIGLSVGLSLPNALSTLDEDTDTDDNDTYECPSPGSLRSVASRGLQANPPEWALTNLCSTSKHIPFQPAAYEYDDSAGAEVDIYVFDTGIEHDQTQFGTRVVDEVNESDEHFKDLAGHGTKVASLIASKDYGIAKSANLYSVKFREMASPIQYASPRQ